MYIVSINENMFGKHKSAKSNMHIYDLWQASKNNTIIYYK